MPDPARHRLVKELFLEACQLEHGAQDAHLATACGGDDSLRAEVERLLEQRKEQARELEQWKRKLVAGGSRDLAAEARRVDGLSVLGAAVDLDDPKALRELADSLRDRLAPAVVALGGKTADGRALLVCTVSKELTKRFRAGDIIKELAAVVSGGGGGRPDFAQAGGSDASKLEQALARVYELTGTA